MRTARAVLTARPRCSTAVPRRRLCATAADETTPSPAALGYLEIGGARRELFPPARADLVPRLAYGGASSGQTSLPGGGSDAILDSFRARLLGSCPIVRSHLQFMLEKDALSQDVMLLGPPGPLRRWLVSAYCSLAGREVEYIALSRDTGEAELKQRRELRASTAHDEGLDAHALSAVFVDGPAVRAARHGRVLILDGIEKAERNILPILNNLLENREMGLEDGTRLLAAERFDDIVRPLCETRGIAVESQEAAQLARDELGLVRVSPDFRVFALALPVPRYPGNSLDPPLRSRFQGRYISGVSVEGIFSLAAAVGNNIHAPGDAQDSMTNSVLRPMLQFSSAVFAMSEPDIDPAELEDMADDPKVTRKMARAAIGGHDNLTLAQSGGKSWRDFRRGSHGERHGSKESARATVASFVKPPPQVPLGGLLAASRSCVELSANNSASVVQDVMLSSRGFTSLYPSTLLSVEEEHAALSRDAHEALVGDKDVDFKSVTMQEGKVVWTLNTGQTLSLPWDGQPRRLFDRFVDIPSSDTNKALAAVCFDLRVCGSPVLLCGPHGSGKMTVVRQAAGLLGWDTELITCFRDMSARDLFQRRATDKLRNTTWADSPLVRAALNGELCVLQNVDRLHPGNLSVLSSMLSDGEATLPDGTRMLAAHRFDPLAVELLGEKTDVNDSDVARLMHDRYGLRRISPRFRVVATAALATPESSVADKTSSTKAPRRLKQRRPKWLSEELLNIFVRSHVLDSCTGRPLEFLLRKQSKCSKEVAKTLSRIDSVLRELCVREPEAARALIGRQKSDRDGISSPLSVRQLCRIGSAVGADTSLLREHIERVLLVNMMSDEAKILVERALSLAKIPKAKATSSRVGASSDPDFWRAHPASRSASESPDDAALIPSVLFFEIPHHEALLRELADEFTRNEHLLLIGAQGTGKNKLTDALCERLRLPRQYMQLHRDTTVSQLTTSLGVEDGRVVRRDSPLIIAARQGHVLVLDEADKAPLEVVAILRAVVDGEVSLADGRKLISHELVDETVNDDETIVVMHPNFRLLVLANRPGFPFLGNDLFSECGDTFSPFFIDNPDLRSEVALLSRYAPSVESAVLHRIAGAFSALRGAAEKGELRYPYSTREAVSVARHLEYLTNNSLLDEDARVSASLDNVLSFDASDNELAAHLARVFTGFDLAVGGRLARAAWVHTAAAATSNNRDVAAARALAKFLSKDIKAFRKGENANRDLPVRFVWDTMKSNLNVAGAASRAPWHTAPPLQGGLSGPKPGKVDPSNSPHVGGNTWAGGTGGRDTAGLGGVGGPYRLDAGHDVHQISDEEKRVLDENEAAKAAARKVSVAGECC
jgi:MoxR-like ATPase